MVRDGKWEGGLVLLSGRKEGIAEVFWGLDCGAGELVPWGRDSRWVLYTICGRVATYKRRR